MWIPTVEDVAEIHERILDRTGGATGILNLGTLAGAVDRARWGPFEGSGDLSERAAHLVRGIGLDHPFVDGNKRTAFEAADTIIRRNGWYVATSVPEATAFVLAVARGELDLDAIADWLRERVRPLPDPGPKT